VSQPKEGRGLKVRGMYRTRNLVNGKCYARSPLDVDTRLCNRRWHLECGAHRRTIDADKRRAKSTETGEKSAKTYTAVTPSGEPFLAHDLERFRSEQGIPHGSPRKILAHRCKTAARGWRFEKAREIPQS
jgi:hypothetical protein